MSTLAPAPSRGSATPSGVRIQTGKLVGAVVLAGALMAGAAAGFMVGRSDAPEMRRAPLLEVQGSCVAKPPGVTASEARLEIRWRSGSDDPGPRGVGISAPVGWSGPISPWDPEEELNGPAFGPPAESPAGVAAERWAAAALRAGGARGWPEEGGPALDWHYEGTFVLTPSLEASEDREITQSVWSFGLIGGPEDLRKRYMPQGSRLHLEVAFFDLDGSSTVRPLDIVCR